MRMIGHIGNKASASTFSDFLYVQGIANELEQEKEGWAVWIHSEDELDKARTLLSNFLTNPADPKYKQQARRATQLKELEAQEEEEAGRRYFDRDKTFRSTVASSVGPVTTGLIVASIVVTVLNSYGLAGRWLEALVYSQSPTGAPEILHGQVWRLVTPIFFHANLQSGFGFLHLLFNALWMYSLGSAVENTRGSRWLLLFTVVIAAVSNTGQYLVSHSANFGGLSGVVYALLGYIWMKGKFDPNSDLVLPPQTVTMMLIWYFLCLFGFMSNIANTIHTIGLLMGMAWGYLSSLQRR